MVLETELAKLSAKHGLKKESYLKSFDADGLEYKDGKYAGLEKSFEKFKTDNPDLFGATQQPSGGSDNKPGSPQSQTFVEKMLKRAEEKTRSYTPEGWDKVINKK